MLDSESPLPLWTLYEIEMVICLAPSCLGLCVQRLTALGQAGEAAARQQRGQQGDAWGQQGAEDDYIEY